MRRISNHSLARRKRGGPWAAALLLLALAGPPPTQGSDVEASAGIAGEQLILFVRPGVSKVSAHFGSTALPSIRALAGEMGLSLEIRDVSAGVPPGVTMTPALVFQNHRGRSIYQGRTTTYGRMKNFIRTARFVPQGGEPLTREKGFLWESERAKIVAAVKITPLEGNRPSFLTPGAFHADAMKAMAKAFRNFRWTKGIELHRMDRLYYMDIYPYLSDEGALFISTALFSQFHCKEPVFIRSSEPFAGPWKERKEVFREAARALEDAVEASVRDVELGDGFDAVPAAVPLLSWEALGLPLPAPPAGRAAVVRIDRSLPLHWVLDEPEAGDPPIIQFRFPPPLDGYTGEVRSVTAEFHMVEEDVLAGATGLIDVDPFSVTMGLEALDRTIHGAGYLNAGEHARSRLAIEAVTSGDERLAFGRITAAGVQARFTMKGVDLPLDIAGQVEPVIGDDGTPRLLVSGSFHVDLRTFGIPGADGPAPQRYMLVFDGNVRLRPGGAP